MYMVVGLRGVLCWTPRWGASCCHLLAYRNKKMVAEAHRHKPDVQQKQWWSNLQVANKPRIALPVKNTYIHGCRASTTGGRTDDDYTGFETDDDDFKFLREICAIPDAGHQVMVIQPYIKLGPRKPSNTTPELQLSELCALVETLPNWNVVRQKIAVMKHPKSNQLFGPGLFKQLKQEIRSLPDISAVVLGTDHLTQLQLSELYSALKLPVFDRYTIVLQIFKDHAKTKEAKLQVALAEIPYVRLRLNQIQQGDHDWQTSNAELVGGTGEVYFTQRKKILQGKESKLKKYLEKLKNQRSLLRQNRQRNQIPTVAVVGYTNSGKTTLIKALTADASMEPKDQLFATLDVTAHGGTLPNSLRLIFIDTVGFISAIPLALIDAFSATLEDAMLADVVVHVRDISHPDTVAQKMTVEQTLARMLSPALLENMIEVCNKADRLPKGQEVDMSSDAIVTSAVSGEGLDQLRQRLQAVAISSCGQLQRRLRIPATGPLLAWLYKEATVKNVDACVNSAEHLVVDVVITKTAYQRMKKLFRRQ